VRPRAIPFGSPKALGAIAGAVAMLAAGAPGQAQTPPSGPFLEGEALPSGALITPRAAKGAIFTALDPRLAGRADFRAGQAVALALDPNGRTLLVLTSGYNRNFGANGRPIPGQSDEYVFVYDIAGPTPRKLQVLQVPNSFAGIAWHPDGRRFFVTTGPDDGVQAFARKDGSFAADGPPIPLGHKAGLGPGVRPMAAGLAVSPDGRRLLTANNQNDSVTLVDLERRAPVAELDLRPGKLDPRQTGVAGGEYPYAVVWVSTGKAYVTSLRDREVIALAIEGDGLAVSHRIKTRGQPNAIVADRAATRLYVAADNSDSIVAIDTAANEIEAEFAAAAPEALLPNPEGLNGAAPNGLALAPDERTLFVSLGGLNAVSVIQLAGRALGAGARATAASASSAEAGEEGAAAESRVIGLVPTGWYPNAVAVRSDGAMLYVVNGKSKAGPNPGGCRDALATAFSAAAACAARNRYVWQLEKAGFLALPMPSAAELARLSWQVAYNNRFPAAARRHDKTPLMGFLRRAIKHVIYVVKENRSYDQVLGDLEVGNGDPRLTLLPEPLSPNHHALARAFVTLDNFFASGETSGTGWNWSTAARTTDFVEKIAPVDYAGRGFQYDYEGLNRWVNVGRATPAERREANPATSDDPDLLPGTADVAAPDGPGGEAGAGYLWDGALKAGLSLRNYGFFGDFTLYDPKQPGAIPLLREPQRDGRRVFVATKAALAPVSDPFYRGFDMRFPDFWRIKEWERDFDSLLARGAVPNLMLVRLPNDHFGNFGEGLDGVDTVETQMADNDYALGRLVEKVAASPLKDSTLIFVVEDDAQNGADHVDAHRTVALVIGPYVRHSAVVSARYTTVSLLRTIEEVLGFAPLGLHDGLAEPMAEVFDESARDWSYTARVPAVLRTTRLPLPTRGEKAGALDPATLPCPALGLHSAAYWADRMRDEDFRAEDRLDTERFNAALWAGRKGEGAPPPLPDGRDLREGRIALLAAWRAEQGCRP